MLVAPSLMFFSEPDYLVPTVPIFKAGDLRTTRQVSNISRLPAIFPFPLDSRTYFNSALSCSSKRFYQPAWPYICPLVEAFLDHRVQPVSYLSRAQVCLRRPPSAVQPALAPNLVVTLVPCCLLVLILLLTASGQKQSPFREAKASIGQLAWDSSDSPDSYLRMCLRLLQHESTT